MHRAHPFLYFSCACCCRMLVPITPRLPPDSDDAARLSREASLRQLGQTVHEECAAVYSRNAAAVFAKLQVGGVQRGREEQCAGERGGREGSWVDCRGHAEETAQS